MIRKPKGSSVVELLMTIAIAAGVVMIIHRFPRGFCEPATSIGAAAVVSADPAPDVNADAAAAPAEDLCVTHHDASRARLIVSEILSGVYSYAGPRYPAGTISWKGYPETEFVAGGGHKGYVLGSFQLVFIRHGKRYTVRFSGYHGESHMTTPGRLSSYTYTPYSELDSLEFSVRPNGTSGSKPLMFLSDERMDDDVDMGASEQKCAGEELYRSSCSSAGSETGHEPSCWQSAYYEATSATLAAIFSDGV